MLEGMFASIHKSVGNTCLKEAQFPGGLENLGCFENTEVLEDSHFTKSNVHKS